MINLKIQFIEDSDSFYDYKYINRKLEGIITKLQKHKWIKRLDIDSSRTADYTLKISFLNAEINDLSTKATGSNIYRRDNSYTEIVKDEHGNDKEVKHERCQLYLDTYCENTRKGVMIARLELVRSDGVVVKSKDVKANAELKKSFTSTTTMSSIGQEDYYENLGNKGSYSVTAIGDAEGKGRNISEKSVSKSLCHRMKWKVRDFINLHLPLMN